MTDGQFDLITGLMRMTSQPILIAARLVLVAGERQVDASKETGCAESHLARAVSRIKDAHESIKINYKDSQ